MRLLIILLISIASLAPSAAWEVRGNIYPVQDGIVEWTSESFAGFNPMGLESLSINISNEKIEKGDAAYRTAIQKQAFEHEEWGQYSSLSFLSQEYFIGYPQGCRIAEPLTLLSSGSGSLGKVLLNSDESYTVASDEPLPLQNGYSLKLSDAYDGVRVSLYKESNLIDSQIILPPSDYIFNASIANKSATCIAAGIKANVRLEPKSFYTIKGLFQVSEDTDPIDMGMEFGEFRVGAISDNGIELNNARDLSLSRGRNFELMNGIRIRTSDPNATFNQLHIYRNSTDLDVPEVRGEIATEGFAWTPQNFPGFYYDMNADLGTEEISTMVAEGNRLEEPDGVTCTTTAQLKDFEFRDWGQYSIISFFGERYLAGYMEDSPLCNDSGGDLLDYERLGRILIDANETRLIEDGANLRLEDGMEARIFVDKPCNSTLIELYRNGALIDRNYFRMPNTYTYKRMFAGTNDEITVIAIHIAGADCSQKKSSLVDGIFQISEEFVDVSENTEYDKMTIQTVDATSIIMNNEDNPIILSKNLDTVLAGGYHIKVIDDKALKYCIYKPVPT
ncbi:MAG: S-layer protein domain-containing protein [Methanothrix sp.]